MSGLLEWYRGLDREEMRVGGARIAYRRVGQGPPLVFVHGWPLHGATFRAVVHALADEFTCVVLDLPGAGDSPPLEGAPDLFGAGADLLEGFVDRLGLDRYGLVGHDSGAAIARLVAARHGPRVAAIVMGNTELPDHVPPTVRVLQWVSRIPGSAAAFGVLLRSRTYVRSGLGFAGCFYDRDLLDGEFHEAFIRPIVANPAPTVAALRHADLAGIGSRLSEAHAAITAPVCCVWGARDPFFPVERLPRLMAELPGSPEPTIVDRARLLVHEEAPETFARVCREASRHGFAELATTAA